ncbi:MAG: radical SAM protein [Nitrospirota bacterium]
MREKLYQMKLIKVNRKSQILKPPVFGCLKDTPSINVTKGCMHSCVYCYARGFTDAPPKGEVHLYQNLPEMLERELDRKKKLPGWVSFSTVSDAFQNMDEILDITYRTMKLLLERGIGMSFLTKGFIPSDFIELFRKYPSMSSLGKGGIKGNVRAKIGLVSLSEDYRKLFEPYTASAFQRLLNIKNLVNAGIEVSVRIDPIIPPLVKGGEGGFSENSIDRLLKRLKTEGVRNISVSALVMRPSIMNSFGELPSNIAQNILKQYVGQPWQSVITSAKTRLLPKNIRIAQYSRIKRIARQYGIDCKICGCKNPDLPWQFCSPWVDNQEILIDRNKNQPNLFSENGFTTMKQEPVTNKICIGEGI